MLVRRPKTLAEALDVLAEGGEDTKVIAGGTAVMLMMRQGFLFPDQIVSLDRLPGLRGVTLAGDEVCFGAMTTLREAERDPTVQAHLPTLAAALPLVANHRVRVRATVAGNLCESDYASDPPSVLTTAGCRVRAVGRDGERWIDLTDLLVDYYETALEPGEVVTEVRVRRPPATARSTYIKYLSRSAEDRPCVGVAALVDVDDSGRVVTVEVAVAGATAVPFRVPDALDEARGAKAADPSTWDAVAGAYRDTISPIADVRGSADYRRHVTGELVRRALATVATGVADGAVKL